MSTAIRQDMGCGYAPRIAAPASVWMPPTWGARDLALTTCPGYTTKLPAVQEVVAAYAQWERGTLRAYLGGDEPTEVALDCLTIFQAGLREAEADAMRAATKGRAT